MKNQLLMALPLMAALAVPSVAQTASSSQTPADQNTQTTTSTSKDQVSTRQPLQYESHEGFWGKINPFARKKYVNRQLDPVRGRVNELDELTAQNSKMIKDVDARATEGIRLASAKANEADMHAIEAGNRAQQANQTIQQANTKLNNVEQVVGNIDQYQPVTQAEIRFRSGQTLLSKNAKQALDEMATPLKDQKGYIVEVQGFSSGKGMTAVQNSQHMAEAVVRYLAMNHDIPIYRIYTVGMGNAPAPATAEGAKPRRTSGGRVEVSVLKNGVGDLNQSAAAAPASSSSMSQGMSSSQGTTSNTTATPSTTTTEQPAANPPADQNNPK
jgi:outer membrane protein OmpA-like peptidoglycan-associated protein